MSTLKTQLLWGLVLTLCCIPVLAQGETATERERALEEKIKRLEHRLDSLEQAQTVEDRERAVETAVNGLVSGGTADDMDFGAYWGNTLKLDTSNKSIRLAIGGRIMNDWTFATQDSDVEANIGDLNDGTEFRRARIYIKGQLYDNVIFKAQYDFAGGDVDFKDVYIGLKDLPFVQNLRVGHFKEPFGLEQLTSSRFLTFAERSLADVFAPSRNTGIMLHGTAADKRVTWAAGLFRETNGYGDLATPEDGQYNVTARVTGLPYFEDDSHLLHLGMAVSFRNPNGDSIRYRQRPEAHYAPRFVDTSTIMAESAIVLGFEAALVLGAFSAQTEVMWSNVDSSSSDDPDFVGFYIQGSYFITGESRAYSRSKGVFGRIVPNHNFGSEEGCGAWELALRYSNLDLEDELVFGGELQSITAGVNWYLNPNTKFAFNYIWADVDDVWGDGNAHLFVVRFQVDF